MVAETVAMSISPSTIPYTIDNVRNMEKNIPVGRLARVTSKGQITVPKAVRDALGLRQGDLLSWELEDGSVRVRAVAPLDVAYLQGLEGTLSEWSSPADEQAFAEL